MVSHLGVQLDADISAFAVGINMKFSIRADKDTDFEKIADIIGRLAYRKSHVEDRPRDNFWEKDCVFEFT